MGCDIHIFAEVYWWGAWELLGRPGLDGRHYELFGKLAGVRGDANPIEEPRGLPIDVSCEVLSSSASWGEDGHTHSWYTLSELESSYWDGVDGGEWVTEMGNRLRTLLSFALLDGTADPDVIWSDRLRIVFWFDN